MALLLAIPAQAGTNSVIAETRPGRTRQWLAKLPLMNPAESLRQLYNGVYALNRIPLKPAARMQLLELYRSPFQYVAEHVEKNLHLGYLPLPEKNLHMAELMRETAVEMAYGYKAIIMEVAATGWRNKKQLDELCVAIQRSIRYLTETLYRSTVYYAVAPKGVWNELHNLYLYAHKLRMSDRQIRDPLIKKNPISSVSQCYKQALLYGLCDAPALTVPAMGKIFRYLDMYSGNAELTPFVEPSYTRCCFTVDPDQDEAPQVYTKGVATEQPKRALLLDTREATKLAHDQLQQLRSGASPKDVGLDTEFFDAGAMDILERMVLAWGIAPKRRNFRTQSVGNYDIAVGLGTANFYFNGEKDFQCVSDDPRVQQQVLAGTFGLQKSIQHNPDTLDRQTASSIDQSEHGLRLSLDIETHANLQLRVGAILVLRQAGTQQAWQLAIVRWMRQEITSLEIGLERAGLVPQSVAVKPVTINSTEEEQFKPSLLLAARPDRQMGRSLITPPGMYRPQRNIFLDDGEVLLMIRARHLHERSRDYEWFEFEELNI